MLGLWLLVASAARAEHSVISLDVVGGLASLSQYERHEAPFWTTTVPALTGGRVQARIAPFDRSGIRGQELLQLLRLGVVPFANVVLSVAAADEPELNAPDLPMLNPDIATLREVVRLWRPRLEATLRDRYGLSVLALYTYPAQVMFCRRPFASLADLDGRKVRASSVGQAELLATLGAKPVVIPFAEIVGAMRAGVVECAVTAALSGNALGLHEAAAYISPIGLGWGVSAFLANTEAWTALPEDIRLALRSGLAALEHDIWEAAARDTQNGLDCNAGRAGCVGGRPGRMTVVESRGHDEERRLRLLADTIVPNWVRRCGPGCADAWNALLAPALGIVARRP